MTDFTFSVFAGGHTIRDKRGLSWWQSLLQTVSRRESISDSQVPILWNVVLAELVEIYQNGISPCNFSLPSVNTKLPPISFYKENFVYASGLHLDERCDSTSTPLLFKTLSIHCGQKHGFWVLVAIFTSFENLGNLLILSEPWCPGL